MHGRGMSKTAYRNTLVGTKTPDTRSESHSRLLRVQGIIEIAFICCASKGGKQTCSNSVELPVGTWQRFFPNPVQQFIMGLRICKNQSFGLPMIWGKITIWSLCSDF